MRQETDFHNRVVLGTAGLGGVWGKVDRGESIEAILMALEAGVAAIDTAPAYADAEQILGAALRQWQGAPPQVSSKAGAKRGNGPEAGGYDYSPQYLRDSALRSLEVLGRARLDVLFLHDPTCIPESAIEAAVQAMADIKAAGLATRIGIGGNYPPAFLPYVRARFFDVFMGYNRLNAICRVALSLEYAQAKGEGMEVWQASPLFMGLLGGKYQTYQDEPPEFLAAGDLAAARDFKAICDTEGLAMPEVALRYLLGRKEPDRIVIGAARASELALSLEAISRGSLPASLFAQIVRLGDRG